MGQNKIRSGTWVFRCLVTNATTPTHMWLDKMCINTNTQIQIRKYQYSQVSLSKGCALPHCSSTRRKKEAMSLSKHTIAPEAKLKFEKMGPDSLTCFNFHMNQLWMKDFAGFSMCFFFHLGFFIVLPDDPILAIWNCVAREYFKIFKIFQNI